MSGSCSDWFPLASKDERFYDDAWTGYEGAAVYELGTLTGGHQHVALYFGTTGNLSQRWSAYASHGSHLGVDKLTLSAFYASHNVLFGRFQKQKSKAEAENLETAVLGHTPFVWNFKRTSLRKTT